MIHLLLGLALSFASHAKMVKPAAPEVPDFAPDGTPVAQLVPFDEFLGWPNDQQRKYLGAIHIALVRYEERMAPHLFNESVARQFHEIHRLFQTMLGTEAFADLTPTQPDRQKTSPIYRCIIAGWPIQADKCEAPNSGTFFIKEGQSVNLNCAANEMLCNPIVFGVESDLCRTQSAAESTPNANPSTTPSPKPSATGTPAPTPTNSTPYPGFTDPVPDRNGLINIALKSGSTTSPKTAPAPRAAAIIPRNSAGAVKPVCISKANKKNASITCLNKAKDAHTCINVKANLKEAKNFWYGFDAICGEKGLKDNKYFKGRESAMADMRDTCGTIKTSLDRGLTKPILRSNQPGGTGTPTNEPTNAPATRESSDWQKNI